MAKRRASKKPSPSKTAQPSDKERAFIEFYLVSWNAASAARKAGYEPSNARFTGRDLLTKAHIRKAIKERLKELCMSSEEFFVRVTSQARASLEDFIDDNGEIDLNKAREADCLHLLESFETEEFFRKDNEGEPLKVIKRKVKLHSVQAALKMVGERLNFSESKKAAAELQNLLLKHKLEELQKKEALLDLIKRKASPEVYRALLEILSLPDEDESSAPVKPGEGKPDLR
jgi:phage terminase small subunit